MFRFSKHKLWLRPNNRSRDCVNLCGLRMRHWTGGEPTTNRVVKVEDVNDDTLLAKLINDGFDNVTMNDFKIKIYGGHYHNIVKYYQRDYFCHMFCLQGFCNRNCQAVHCVNTKQLVNDPKNVTNRSINQATILVNYFWFCYNGNSSIMAHVYGRFGDIFRVTGDFVQAGDFYRHAFALSPPNNSRNIAFAQLLNQKLNDWIKSKEFFEIAINDTNKKNMSYPHFAFGMALAQKGPQELDRAIDQFRKAIECKGPNPRYYLEYGKCLMRKGPKHFADCFRIFTRVVDLADPSIPRSRRVCESALNNLSSISEFWNSQQMVHHRNRSEFDYMWSVLKFSSAQAKQTYADRLARKQYHYSCLVMYFEEDILRDEIGMNEADCAYFMKVIRNRKLEHRRFEDWIKCNQLYDLYFVRCIKYSIYTMESLVKFVTKDAPQQWATILLKYPASRDIWMWDAKMICDLLNLPQNAHTR